MGMDEVARCAALMAAGVTATRTSGFQSRAPRASSRSALGFPSAYANLNHDAPFRGIAQFLQCLPEALRLRALCGVPARQNPIRNPDLWLLRLQARLRSKEPAEEGEHSDHAATIQLVLHSSN